MNTTRLILFSLLMVAAGAGLRAQSGDHSVTTDPANQVEMAIALKPLNSSIQLGGWNNVPLDSAISYPGYGFSTDGGANWVIGLFARHGADPSVGFDKHNVAYYCYLNKDSNEIYVSRTSNLGAQWHDTAVAPAGSIVDKPYMAIDNTGRTYDGRIYVAWKVNAKDVHFSYSTNGGISFSTEVTIHQESGFLVPLAAPRKQCPIPVIGPNNLLYIVYMDYSNGDNIVIRKSTNGGATFGSQTNVTQFTYYESLVGNYNIFDFPSAAVDMNTGRLYVVYHSGDIHHVKISLTYSDDGGASWDSPQTIGDLGSNTWQFHPWITVDPTGKVSVSFMDTVGTNYVNAYLIESFDNGNTFGSARKLSSYPSNATLGYGHEYQGLASTIGVMYPLWTEMRDIDGNANPYTARVTGLPTSSSSFATASGASPKSVYTTGDGRWNALFQSNGSLYYMYSTNTGTSWDGYERISGGSSLGSSSNPGLVASSNGSLHAVWVDPGNASIDYNRRVSGSWLAGPITLLASSSTMPPSIASGGNDSMRVVWVQSNTTLSPDQYWLKHGTFKVTDANPLLRNVSVITSSSGAITTPSIAVGANDTSHVVWQQASNIYYSFRAGNTWSSPQLLSDQTKPSSSPSILAIGSTIYVTWQASYSGNLEICFRSRSGGTWGSIQNISNTSGSSVEPSISTLPSLGEPCVVWSDNTGGTYNIRYSLPVSGGGGSFKSTSLDSHNPTVTCYHVGLADRILALWTEGSSTPFIIDSDHRDMQLLAGGPAAKAGEILEPRPVRDVPTDYLLAEGYPNPFNPTTEIKFDLPKSGNISIVIFDDLGRDVATLANGYQEAGYHSVVWNASSVASGVYYIRMVASNDLGRAIYSKVNKLLLIK